MTHTGLFASFLMAVIGGAAGCGGAAPQQPAARQSAAAPSALEPSPPKPWNDMTKRERGQYMGEVVLPRMKALFQSFDAQRFAVVDCATCHGSGAADRSFTMPNAELAGLPDNASGFMALAREKPQWMHFMANQVRPKMAALLGKEEVDMRNPKPEAFGCRNCHVLGSKEAGASSS